MALYSRRRNHRNGGKKRNGHRTPVQIDGRTIRGLSNGSIHERNKIAAMVVRGDAEPVRLNAAQAAVLFCSTAGVYGALRQM